MNSSIIFRFLFTFLLFSLLGSVITASAQENIPVQQEKKEVQEKTKDHKTASKPETKPEIASVPKARKQLRPTVVKPVIAIKPIKVIKPKIKKP